MPENSEGLRGRILDAARHIMVNEGFAALSMRKIASAIGYSATSIYLHFSNKDELFHTLIDEGMDLLNEALADASSGDTAGSRSQLQDICRAYVGFGLDNREFYEVMFVLHPETSSRYPVEMYRKARANLNYIEEALLQGKEAGVFAFEDSYEAAIIVWSMLHGLVTLTIADRVDSRLDGGVLLNNGIACIIASMESDRSAHSTTAGV